MPHTRNKPVPGSLSPGFKPANFININLTRDQVDVIKAAEWDIVKCDAMLHALLFDGFKVSVRFDMSNNCFAAWMIPPDGHKWSGSILAGRGSTPTKAIKQLLYIHHIVLDCRWDTVQDQPTMEIDD